MRPQARVKMGYYPTPPAVVERIRSFLDYPAQAKVNLLDPCCGEGLALSKLADGANTTTYGIELDAHRAEHAREKLDHVLKCGYEDARISHNSFSCLFLNPPYDWSAATESERTERIEQAFLRGTARYVCPAGVLVYIVPQHRVSESAAKLLSYRFTDLDAYQFPEEDYEAYRQVVVFGTKKPRPQMDFRDFERVRAIPGESLPDLPYRASPTHGLPATPDVGLFRSSLIEEEQLERELRESRLWQALNGHANGRNGQLGRPPLPLHTGHLGLLLASGELDGVVGEGQDRHVVRGKVEKLVHTHEEYEGDVVVEREIERYQVSIKILRQNGELTTLM